MLELEKLEKEKALRRPPFHVNDGQICLWLS